MSTSFKNPAKSKNVSAPLPIKVAVGAAPLPNKTRRVNREESEEKTPDTSKNSESVSTKQETLSHPQKKPLPPQTTKDTNDTSMVDESESGTSSAAAAAPTRAPRDPHGHKLIKVADVLESGHKTKYLPLGDGSYTYPLYFQPMAMRECGKTWCEMEMFELINGTQTTTASRIYSIDAEDLLKMCYLHAMAQLDVAGEPRLHYEQWVLSVFQEYCAECGSADYTDRGSIAMTYLDKIAYSFKIGGAASRLQIFFQKRCIRDLGTATNTTEPVDNANVVIGKTAKAKFEYQIEGFIMAIPDAKEESEEMSS